MVDFWDVPEGSHTPDLITARVSEALNYALVLLQQTPTGRRVVRKNLVRDLDINRDTLRLYLSPVLDDDYRLISGPTKISVFHGIMHAMEVRPSQLYEAAETSRSYLEFIHKVTHIVLREGPREGCSGPVSAFGPPK